MLYVFQSLYIESFSFNKFSLVTYLVLFHLFLYLSVSYVHRISLTADVKINVSTKTCKQLLHKPNYMFWCMSSSRQTFETIWIYDDFHTASLSILVSWNIAPQKSNIIEVTQKIRWMTFNKNYRFPQLL
jgi:hypothetical protein